MKARKPKPRPPGPDRTERVFAYGSNLVGRQMRERCPTSRLLCTAKLAQHRLAFGGNSARWQGAVATILPDPERAVWGVIYEITTADLERLDGFEGAPRFYRRKKRTLVCPRLGIRQAWVYDLNADAAEALVSIAYAGRVLDGYREHGLDELELDRALEWHRIEHAMFA